MKPNISEYLFGVVFTFEHVSNVYSEIRKQVKEGYGSYIRRRCER